jgi:hypothetical protein
MNQVAWLGVFAVTFTLTAAPIARADTSAPDRQPSQPGGTPQIAVYVGEGVGSVLDKAGGAAPSGGTLLAVTVPIVRVVAIEIMGASGYALGKTTGTEDDFWLRLALGLRIEDSLRKLRPYGAFRLVHLHYAPVQTWIDHPGDSIAGSSSEGLDHRSGMALAGGLSWTVPRTKGKLRLMGEAELAWVPIGTGPEWFLTTTLGAGLAF